MPDAEGFLRWAVREAPGSTASRVAGCEAPLVHNGWMGFPSAMVTLLFTDMEGSVGLREAARDRVLLTIVSAVPLDALTHSEPVEAADDRRTNA